MSDVFRQPTRPSKTTPRPRMVLAHLLEYTLLGGIVAAMAVGVMRLQ